MKTKHILTALALPTMFAACTADDIVSENNAMQQAERAKLSKDFVLNVNNGVESRYAVEGSTSLNFVFEEGDLIGANLIDVYDPDYKGFKANDPATWKIVKSIAPALPFENVNGVWKSAGELGIGNYLFTNPYNPADKNRAAAKYELPVIVQYDSENPNAHVEAYNKAVSAAVLREGETEASISLKNIFAYPKFVINFDKSKDVTKVDKIILKKKNGFIVKGALHNEYIVQMFSAKELETFLKNNKDKSEADYWAQFETTHFVVDGGEVDRYKDYATITPSEYIIYEMNQEVVDNSIEVRMILPSIADLTAGESSNDEIWMYIVTDKGGFKVELSDDASYAFKETTLEAKIKKALARNSSNTLKIEKLTPATTAEMNNLKVNNIVSDVEDWNALVAKYGDLEKYSAEYNKLDDNGNKVHSDAKTLEVNIINSDFVLNSELDMPAVAEFIIKSNVAVEGDITLKNIKADGKLIVKDGATLTTDATLKAEKVEVEEGGELVFAAVYNKKNELEAYENVKNVCNHGTVTVPTGVIAKFALTNAKDAVVNVGAESRSAEEAVANLSGSNYGIINNYGVINVADAFTNNAPSSSVKSNDEELAGYKYDSEAQEWDGVPTINNFGSFNAKNVATNNGLFINNGVLTSSFVGDAYFNNVTIADANYTATLEIAKNAETYIDTNTTGLIVLSELTPAKFTIHNAKEASSYNNSYYGEIKYTLNDKSANTVDLSTSPVTHLVTNVGINLTKTFNYKASATATVNTVKALPILEVNGGEVKISTTKNTATPAAYVAQVTKLIVNGEVNVADEIASVSNVEIKNDAVLGVPAGAKLTVETLDNITTAPKSGKKEAGKLAVNGTLHLSSTTVAENDEIYGGVIEGVYSYTNPNNANIILHKGVFITVNKPAAPGNGEVENRTVVFNNTTLKAVKDQADYKTVDGNDTYTLVIKSDLNLNDDDNKKYLSVLSSAKIVSLVGPEGTVEEEEYLTISNLTNSLALSVNDLTIARNVNIMGTANMPVVKVLGKLTVTGASTVKMTGWIEMDEVAQIGMGSENVDVPSASTLIIVAKDASGKYLKWIPSTKVWGNL